MTHHDPDNPDAALVTAVLAPLNRAGIEDPERYLVRDTPGVPRTRAGWTRVILRALRAAGATVIAPDAREEAM